MPKIHPAVHILENAIPGFWVKSLPITGMATSLILALIAASKGREKV